MTAFDTLPNSWTKPKVSYEYEVTLGKMIQSVPTKDSSISCLYHKSATVQDGRIEEPATGMYANQADIQRLSIHKGDLLVCEGGDIARSALVADEPDTPVIFQNSVHRVRSRGKHSVEWLHYVLQHLRRSGGIEAIVGEKNTIAHFTNETFRKVHIPLPPIDIENSLVTLLNSKCAAIDSLIAAKQVLLDRLREYRAAVINNAVTEEQWSGSSGQWQKYPFSQLFILGRGLGITKADLVQTGVACLSYGQIHSYCNGFYDDSKHKLPFVSEEYLSSAPESLLHKGDFVFADTSEDLEGAGNCSCVIGDGPVFAGYHTIIARPVRDVNSRYLGYYFQSDDFRKQIREEVNGIKVYSITNTILKRTRIALPPIVVQEQIATELDKKCSTIATLVNQEQTAIETLKEYRQSLITAAVTGQLDLDNN